VQQQAGAFCAQLAKEAISCIGAEVRGFPTGPIVNPTPCGTVDTTGVRSCSLSNSVIRICFARQM
jgi:hypothetical protein